MPARSETHRTLEGQGKINHEAGNLTRRLDARLEQSPIACIAAMSSWLDERDLIVFSVLKGDPQDNPPVDRFIINRRSIRPIRLGRSGIGGSVRRVGMVSVDGTTETRRTLLIKKFDEPTPESGIEYFRVTKEGEKVTERVTLKDLEAAHDSAELIDMIPTSPVGGGIELSLIHPGV